MVRMDFFIVEKVSFVKIKKKKVNLFFRENLSNQVKYRQKTSHLKKSVERNMLLMFFIEVLFYKISCVSFRKLLALLYKNEYLQDPFSYIPRMSMIYYNLIVYWLPNVRNQKNIRVNVGFFFWLLYTVIIISKSNGRFILKF